MASSPPRTRSKTKKTREAAGTGRKNNNSRRHNPPTTSRSAEGVATETDCTNSSEERAEMERLRAELSTKEAEHARELSMKDYEISRLKRTLNDGKNEISYLRVKIDNLESKAENTGGSSPTSRSSSHKKAKTSQNCKKPTIKDIEQQMMEDIYIRGISDDALCHTYATMKAQNVVPPFGWEVGVLFTGNVLVDEVPRPGTLKFWLLTNRKNIQENSNVTIKPSKVEGRGKGLFAAIEMKRGKVVGYYSGHLRERVRGHNSRFVAPVDLQIEGYSAVYEIDAKYCGNEARFINHFIESIGEKPNVELRTDGKTGKIRVVAIRDIKADDEILRDYGPEYTRFLSIE